MHSISQSTSSFSKKGTIWIGVKFSTPPGTEDLCCCHTGWKIPTNIHFQDISICRTVLANPKRRKGERGEGRGRKEIIRHLLQALSYDSHTLAASLFPWTTGSDDWFSESKFKRWMTKNILNTFSHMQACPPCCLS